MPRVLNKRWGNLPHDAIYVGRPTKWGNLFSHLDGTLAKYRVGSREEAITRYEEWIMEQPQLLDALDELRGHDLVCWCAPHACHADILLRLANRIRDGRV